MRKAHSDGAKTYRAIRTAAVDLIYQYGFNGTSMRRLAAEVGIDQSTLYYHIKSKHNLLFQIHTDVKEEYLAGLDDALSVSDPEERLRRFVRYHVAFRFRLRKMSFITATELRSLKAAARKIPITVQREVLGRLQRTIEQGISAKVFNVGDAKVAALAIVQLLNGINTWHTPGGRFNDDEIIEMHTQFVLGLLRSGKLRGKLSPAAGVNGNLRQPANAPEC